MRQACCIFTRRIYSNGVSAGEDGFDYAPAMAALCARDYVDIEKASCSFDSDSFKAQLQLLELQEAAKAESFPCNGLLYYDVIADAGTVAYRAERYLLPPMEQYVFCGYPSDHANGSVLHFSELFAINANSKQKSGAWAFLYFLPYIRQCFSPIVFGCWVD